MFTELLPLVKERTLMLIIADIGDKTLRVNVIPKRIKDGENTALLTPLCCTGTAEELDRAFPAHLRDFVAGHIALTNNLGEIERERQEAEKAAREEAKKRQKAIAVGGKKPSEPVTPAACPKTPSPVLSLFDQVEPAAAAQSTPPVESQSTDPTAGSD